MSEDREPPPWSASAGKTLLENPYFSVLVQDVRVTDGSARTYYSVRFPGPAVGIVARSGLDILLVRQYRFIVDQFVWAIPSGGVGPGETSEAAAIRELEEEAGYTTTAVRPLLNCFASYGCSDQRFEIFIADDVHRTNVPFDENEVIEARWFSADDVFDLIDRNGVVDNLSLSPLLYVLLMDERRIVGRHR